MPPWWSRRVRLAIVALLLVLPLAPLVAAQEGAGPDATLTIDVQDDRTEKMTLQFDGLRLTRYNDLCLPASARESSVRDELGEVPYDARDEDGRRVIAFTARAESVTVTMSRPAPGAIDRPLYSSDANFCVPAGSHVKAEVRVPEGHTLFFLSEGGAIQDGRVGSVEKDGPLHVFYSYEGPLAGSGLQAFDVPPFRVFADAGVADQAQEAARLAVGPFRAALAEAGLDAPFGAIRVIYQEETPFSWEAGHYSGHGYVTVKEDTLQDDPAEGWPLKAVKILLHEAFHAASFPYGSGAVTDKVSWWLEGTAKHSERQVDSAMPNSTIHCEKSATEVSCRSFDDRIKRPHLETGYQPEFTFDPRWEPSLEQTDETRTFYYAYSEYVVGAWIARRGAEAYRDVWDEIEAAFRTGAGCPCGEGWLLGRLGDESLFTPWDDVKSADPDRFETLVKPFVQDQSAVDDALKAAAGPLGLGIPLPMWSALVAALVALALRRP